MGRYLLNLGGQTQALEQIFHSYLILSLTATMEASMMMLGVLGFVSLVACQEVPGPVPFPVPKCNTTDTCKSKFNTLGRCINMLNADVTTLPYKYDLRAGADEESCKDGKNFECCRCLKMRDPCRATRDCAWKRGERVWGKCYTKGNEPASLVPLPRKCDEKQGCACYGPCAQQRDCTLKRGRCYKEGFQPRGFIKVNATCDPSKNCSCFVRPCPISWACQRARGKCYANEGDAPKGAVQLEADCNGGNGNCTCWGRCSPKIGCRLTGGSCWKNGTQPLGAIQVNGGCNNKGCLCFRL